jgi:alkaline phosphatase
MERTIAARQIVLAIAVFAATLVILLGLSAVLRTPAASSVPSAEAIVSPTPTRSSPTATPASEPSATGSPSASADASSDASGSPSSSAPPGTDPILVGAGDIATCDGQEDEATADLLASIVDGAEGPVSVFTAGDNVYPEGTTETYRDCFDPSWGRLHDVLRPAPGNHDWESGTLDAYRAYFGDAARNDAGDPWYAYTFGTWQVIVLDSDCASVEGCGPDSTQGQWLAQTLAASSARCSIAIWHHPRFSSGSHGDDPTLAPFWDALHAAGVDVVVNGHDHDYERFAPQDPAGREDREGGIREFVVGTGGHDLTPFQTTAANSELRASLVPGVLELTLRDGSYDWRFVPIEGDFSDAGTAFCH